MTSVGFTKMEAGDFSDVHDVEAQADENDKTGLVEPMEIDDAPGKFMSWNPMDWYAEIQKELHEFSWEMTERRRVLLRAVFGEGLCTFLFLFIVEAVTMNNSRQQNPENLVLSAISTAFCSIALIYSFADVSGAHFNPAVTVATIVTGKVSGHKGLMFIGIQLLASVLATSWLYVVFPGPTNTTIPYSVVVDIDSTASTLHAFFMEFSLTFVLVYVIFATAFDTVDTKGEVKISEDGTTKESAGKNLTIYTTSGNTKAGFAPVAIGFTLGFLGLLGSSVSGGAYNPARAFGPALLSGHWDHQWIYWLGDCLGAIAAGYMQSLFAHEAVQVSHAGRTAASARKAKAIASQ
ncbi:hypothetical protein SmJEL517_g01104 [Synchytrium microbalum]|uniref:Uncharacterized protein n=1 Tax=Synchytrium microbalum TaxID=1806994 RepID=A0A507CCL9_9FUNG|nr:uncharacterized protein SmJEL517_g01104 [Synchytrium microbalum]TPX37241.1 hypothetical protein SmJEL517_g01104 [Synchytrium microbalum]